MYINDLSEHIGNSVECDLFANDAVAVVNMSEGQQMLE